MWKELLAAEIAHDVVDEGSRPGTEDERAIESRWVLERRYSRPLYQKMLRFDLDPVRRKFLAKGLWRIV